MANKYGGDIAVAPGGSLIGADLHDALASAALHETLVPSTGPPLLVVVSARDGGVGLRPLRPSEAARRAIANSQMRSMLADGARCAKFARGVEAAVRHAQTSQRRASDSVKVLDIGAGTGLLGMVAARAGAQVDAVEMFGPMARIAEHVVASNALEGRLKVYPHRSTDMSVEDGERYDVVVSEILDTALLGEGVLPVLSHAAQSLLKSGATAVPHSAVVYAQIVESPKLFGRWHSLGAAFPFHRSAAARACCGGSRIVPVHLSALSEGDYTALTDVFPVLDFDFSPTSPLLAEGGPERVYKRLEIPAARAGVPHAVLMWWELDLTGDGSIVYSTRAGAENWQDHWLQGVFPLPQAAKYPVAAGENVELFAGHTQNEIWFSLSKAKSPRLCSCGWHNLRGSSPARIAVLGDVSRTESLRRRISAAIDAHFSKALGMASTVARVLDVSTCSSVAGLVAAAEARSGRSVHVWSLETEDEYDSMEMLLFRQSASSRCFLSMEGDTTVDENQFRSLSIVGSFDELYSSLPSSDDLIDVLVAEPYHPALSLYPTAVASSLWIRRAALATVFSPSITTVPARCSVFAQLVEFSDSTFTRNFLPAGLVDGLDHVAFDEVIAEHQAESTKSFEVVSLPLYMYSHKAISAREEVYGVSFADMPPARHEATANLVLKDGGRLHAVCIYVEFDGEPGAREECVEVLVLHKEATVESGDNVVLTTVWDRAESGLGFSISVLR